MGQASVVEDTKGNPVLVKNSSIQNPEPSSDNQPEPHPLEHSVKPEEVGWDEWSRRQSAVRSMAREYDEMDYGDIKDFLDGRLNRELSDDEVASLYNDIRAHRISDLADIFDDRLRSTTERLKRGRRTVRVAAPKGWTNRAFNNLDQSGVEQLCEHLISRGHDSTTIKEKVVSRVADEDTRNAIIEKLDAEEE